MAGLEAFAIFAATMGSLVFVLCLLGTTSSVTLARPLRIWGRRVQVVTAALIVIVGGALAYDGIAPHFFDRLLLGHG